MIAVDAILGDTKFLEAPLLGSQVLLSVEQRAYPMRVGVMGRSVRKGVPIRNCYRTIQMKRIWPGSGGGRGDGLDCPVDVLLADSDAPAGMNE